MKPLVLALLAAALLTWSCGDYAPAPSPTNPPGGAFPRVDGTVDPLGFGGTEPVTIKPNPDPPVQAITLTDVRIGAHPEEGGWDRIVFQFDRDLPQGEISYVQSVFSCGPGELVAIQGQAILAVRFLAQAHNDQGMSTIKARELKGPGGAIIEARMYCDFEGHLNWAIGLDSRSRFKVTRLSNPTRLVIDIKQ